ncbi:YIP1 family protein [Paenibacillus larvae]|uniref:Yip1 domain protein n=1 Tax=Paenibacillus larvae subsp. larvae TaxID=147375 RepID=A0A6C0QL75_9BACL|nr:YIP1 family protein [Paenibacillus larvae]QHZ49495.1 Yip1 domain protein [Paenibacillus larvae subsp. larvae]
MKIRSLFQIFFHPKQVLQTNLQHGNLFFPILFISLLSGAFSLSTVWALPDNFIGQSYLKAITGAFAVIYACLIPLFSIFILSIINYIALAALDAFTPFRKLMIIGLYAYMPLFIDSALKLVMTLYLGKAIAFSPTSLTLLLPPDASFLLNRFINSLSFSGLWSIGIYLLGVSLLVPESKKRKVIVVLLVLNILLSVIPNFLTMNPLK